MEDLKKKAKMSVLEDLISMMKEKEAEDFKGKSSKFLPKAEMTIEVESEDPEEDKMDSINHIKEMRSMGVNGNDRFMGDMKSKKHDHDEMMSGQDDEDDIERLKEIYSRLK